ncbi:MAG: glycosyltransferase [Actinomycetota bacterium]
MPDVVDDISLAIVPRERWSLSVPSLQDVLNTVPAGIELVYVDGGSPHHIADELRQIVAGAGGTYIRRDYVLAPQEAKNLAAAATTKPFILYVDNDVAPDEGFLEPLHECALETGAAAVGPLIMHGARGGSPIVHIAGGDIRIENGRIDDNDHRGMWSHIDDMPPLERSPSSQLEFHAILVRREALDELGGFDEGVLSMCDHEDFVLAAAEKGWPLYFEPASRVTYRLFAPLTEDDYGFWQLRWSEEWNAESFRYFCDKWDVRDDVGWPDYGRRWSSKQRMWWHHKQGRLHTATGAVLRKLVMIPYLCVPFRTLEQRALCRAGAIEHERRTDALAAASPTA